MLVETIRGFNQAVPFRPYEIRTNGGRRFRVPHPDFVFVSPRGEWVMVVVGSGAPHHINSSLIEEVAPLGRRRQRATGSQRD